MGCRKPVCHGTVGSLCTALTYTHVSTLLSVPETAFRTSTDLQTTLSSIENTNVHGWSRALVSQTRGFFKNCTLRPNATHSPAAVSPRSIRVQRRNSQTERTRLDEVQRTTVLFSVCCRLSQVLALTVAPVDGSEKGAFVRLVQMMRSRHVQKIGKSILLLCKMPSVPKTPIENSERLTSLVVG